METGDSGERASKFRWWSNFGSGRVERWLEEREAQGWRLEGFGFLGLVFRFRKGAPRTVRYCLDYQARPKPDYGSIFADSGWEGLPGLAWSGWHCWRKEYSGERPEIYTDAESLAERNRRVSAVLVVVLMTQLPLFRMVLARLVGANALGFAINIAYIAVMMAYLVFMGRWLASNARSKAARPARERR